MPVIIEGPSIEQMGLSIGKWIQANTIALAEKALIDEVRHGFDAQPEVVTDGVLRRDPNQVKVGGKIEFVARTSIADAVLWALTELQKRSPVLTGRYASTHTIMINNKEVQGNIRVALREVKAGDVVQIVNPQPYARKLEGATASKRSGRGKRAASSRQARGGIYRPVLRALVQRYGRTVYVDYKLVKMTVLGVKVWGAVGGARKGQAASKRQRPKVLRDQVYPALQFFVRPSQSQVN